MADEKHIRTYEQLQAIQTVLARRHMKHLAVSVYPEYTWEWFHNLVFDYLQKWFDGDIRKLAVFMPPQHAKSTLSSVLNPAFILGKNPKAKVVCASYTQTVASKFNRQCQDIMTSKPYRRIFPGAVLPQAGLDMTNELRNASYFETVGHKGFYKSVGVGGSLTGTTVEYGIIDDPIKDRKEANSTTYRNNLWDWYIDVWSTRLNNESREMMLFTRWHEDDLAGRLFDPNNQHYDKERAEQWTVLVIPALKENAPPPIAQAIAYNDPREVGEALWQEKHSREKHEEDKRTNPYMFASLKQQRPSPLEGGLLKADYFPRLKRNELPYNPNELPVHFMVDGAYTDKVENDPTAIMAYQLHGGKVYVLNCHSVRMTLDKFLPYFQGWAFQMGGDQRSNVRIEFKSSGPGMIRMLQEERYGNWNTTRINDKHVSYGKYTRGEYATPALAAGKLVCVEGPWVEAFVKQCITFPNDTHDDMYDLACYVVLQEIHKAGAGVWKTSVNLGGKIV